MNTARKIDMESIDKINGYKKNPYNKISHLNGIYGDDFVYIHNELSGEVSVIERSRLCDFDDIREQFEPEGYKVICYSETVTGTSYKSYIPVDGGVILQTKSKIDNIVTPMN